MSLPRIASGNFRELGPVNWVVCRVISKGAGVPNAHVFSTLGRTRGLFRGWLYYSARLMPGGKISRKETEMVILRVAHLRECQYEMDHHIRLGRRAGVTKELLAQILVGPGAPELSIRYRSLLIAVDELIADKKITDGTWARLAAEFDERQLIEFVLLVTQYDGLATTIGTLGVERDFSQ